MLVLYGRIEWSNVVMLRGLSGIGFHMSDDWVTLALPPGEGWQYNISHGGESFVPFRADTDDPNSPWLVRVPRHAAVHMIHNGGYRSWPFP